MAETEINNCHFIAKFSQSESFILQAEPEMLWSSALPSGVLSVAMETAERMPPCRLLCQRHLAVSSVSVGFKKQDNPNILF